MPDPCDHLGRPLRCTLLPSAHFLLLPLHLFQQPKMTKQTEARQNSAATRKKKAHHLASLPQNTLYINLYIRSDPPLPNDFHCRVLKS